VTAVVDDVAMAAANLAELVRVVHEDQPTRFMQIEFTPGTDTWPDKWEVSICLGELYTCNRPQVVGGATRWLEVSARSYDRVLVLAVQRAWSIRRLR
jgi:hypothetical protein